MEYEFFGNYSQFNKDKCKYVVINIIKRNYASKKIHMPHQIGELKHLNDFFLIFLRIIKKKFKKIKSLNLD